MDRVTVVSRSSCAPLFDSVLPSSRWPAESRSARDAASLIQLFHQFAKDLQGGDVVRVTFEHPVDNERKAARSPFARGGGLQFNPRGVGGRGRAGSIQPQPSQPASPPLSPLSPTSPLSPASSPQQQHAKRVDMFCSDNERVIVAVFVNESYDKDGGHIAVQLRDAFMAQFGAQLARMQAQLNLNGSLNEESSSSSHGSSGGGLGTATDTFLPLFAAFGETIERSGVMRVEPKAAQAAAFEMPAPLSPVDISPPNSADRGRGRGRGELSSSMPTGARSPLRRPLHTHSAAGGFATAASLPASAYPALSAPRADYSLSAAIAAAASGEGGGFAASASPDDYMPSWLVDPSGSCSGGGAHDVFALTNGGGGGGLASTGGSRLATLANPRPALPPFQPASSATAPPMTLPANGPLAAHKTRAVTSLDQVELTLQ